jgi:hypothetical protein
MQVQTLPPVNAGQGGLMKIFRIREGTTAVVHTARKVLVIWEDGGQVSMGVPDHIRDCDIVDFVSSGSGRRVMSWRETEPRDDRPQIPPD